MNTVWAASDACTPPAVIYGTDTDTVNVPATSTYTIWARLKIPSKSANNILLNIDHGSSCFDVGGNAAMPVNTWQWVNYNDGNTAQAIQVTLNQGSHTFELIGINKGVGIDRLEALSDTACVPSLIGNNCAPTNAATPTIQITSPTKGSIVAGTLTVTASATSALGIDQIGMKNVEFEVDGSPTAIDSASPYTFSWNTDGLSDGMHTLSAIATDTQNNQSSTSETVTVANNGCAAGPTAPINLTGTSLTQTSASFGWSASMAAKGCSVKEYTVYRGGTAIGTTSTLSFTDNGLQPDTIYTFAVTATDNSGHQSAQSTPLQLTTSADTTPPSAPSNVRAVAINSSEVKLSWTASTDNVAVAGYRVYRNGNLLAILTSPNVTLYQDETTSANTAYSYQVAAFDTSLNVSALSKAKPYPVTTPKSTSPIPPSAPTDLRATLETPTAIVLSWKVSTDMDGKIAGYHIYRNNTEVGSTAGSTSYTDTPLEPKTSYQYFVVAYDTSANTSSDSSLITATTLPGSTVTCSQGDLTGDGKVDIYSLAKLLSHWGKEKQSVCDGDLDQGSVVNMQDLTVLLNNWGPDK